jgi:two-component system C4-dicarboxylate transport response regulator DctD
VNLLVTDIQMAGLNGLNLIEELGKASIHIPVIIITGWGHEEKVVELKRKENIDCIEKPFAPQELIDLVKKSFARSFSPIEEPIRL